MSFAARPGLDRHEVQHPVPAEVLPAAEAMTGRALVAMQKLAIDPAQTPEAQTPDRSAAAKGRVRLLTPAPGPPNHGRGPARHPAGPAVNLAGRQVGNRASHPLDSGAANQAGKSQEHDS